MSWRRTQRNNKRLQRGVRASDDELRRRVRRTIAPATRIHDEAYRARLESYKRDMEDQLEDWEDWD